MNKSLVLALALAGLELVATPGRADADSGTASREYADAQAAEAQSSWQLAIEAYERAYRAEPSAGVLRNIAINYERLGQLRDAAQVLDRYIAEAESTSEKRQAKAKRNELRDAAASVRFTSEPPGLPIAVDGRDVGVTPMKVTLSAGPHTAVVSNGQSRSQPRRFAVGFGEPLTIDFRFAAQPGTLAVGANVKAARVLVDGISVGPPPYQGAVTAGTHTVRLTARGHRTVTREVFVGPGASESITAALPPMGIERPITAKRVAPRSIQYLVGFGLGVAGGTAEGTTSRGILEAGLRSPTERWDFSAAAGTFGGAIGTGVGVNTRFFLGGRLLRPYVRSAFAVGRVSSDDDKRTTVGLELGVGLRYGMVGRSGFGIEYFLEGNLQFTSADKANSDMEATTSPLLATFLSFPVTIGITIRFATTRKKAGR